MEVRKSLNRFLSIFFIVALGVAFFSGIQATAPDMRATGDYYFDSNQLMDLRVISTLGLTENDLEAIREIDGVENVAVKLDDKKASITSTKSINNDEIKKVIEDIGFEVKDII